MWRVAPVARTIFQLFQPHIQSITFAVSLSFLHALPQDEGYKQRRACQTVGMQKAGSSQSKIARELDIPSGAVSTTLRHLKATGSTESLPRGKRPAKLDKNAKRRVLSDIDTNPQQTWDDLGAKEDVSSRTVT